MNDDDHNHDHGGFFYNAAMLSAIDFDVQAWKVMHFFGMIDGYRDRSWLTSQFVDPRENVL